MKLSYLKYNHIADITEFKYHWQSKKTAVLIFNLENEDSDPNYNCSYFLDFPRK